MAWLDSRKSGYYLRDRNPEHCEPLGKISHRDAKSLLRKFEDAKEEDGAQTGALGKLMSQVYAEYLAYLERHKYSPKTIHVTGQDVLPFIQTVHRVKNLTPAAVDAWNKHLVAYEFRKGRRYALDTIAHRLRAIKSFCSWLVTEKYLRRSPFELSIPEGRGDAGRALQGSDVHALFEHWPTKNSRTGSTDKQVLSKLFFQIVFYGGTRLTEILGDEERPDEFPGAQYERLDRKLGILKLEKTKAGKEREVALPRVVVREIPAGSGPMFRGRIAVCTLRMHLAKAAEAAGIAGRFRIHDGRVTAATEWLRKNRDPKSAMDQFGWKSAKMALHYNKVATKERIAQAQKIDYK